MTREMFYFKVPPRKPEIIKKRKAMSKIMQNLVVLMEPSESAFQIDLKAGNMCLNRFCIDEDATVEISGVHYLRTRWGISVDIHKGKGYLKLTINDILV